MLFADWLAGPRTLRAPAGEAPQFLGSWTFMALKCFSITGQSCAFTPARLRADVFCLSPLTLAYPPPPSCDPALHLFVLIALSCPHPTVPQLRAVLHQLLQ